MPQKIKYQHLPLAFLTNQYLLDHPYQMKHFNKIKFEFLTQL
jgi:hypothetical protein